MDEEIEPMSWTAAEYAWDPHRLVAVQDSSPEALHMGITAARTQPDSVVPPVLGAKLAAGDKASADACCKVEGCDKLLREEKPYYQRFSVCEEHMRSMSITVDGVVSRFCQQCAKFEPIEAFDGVKRSCRARLLEHNKRRRKVGVNNRTLRRQRRNAAASSKASRRARDDAAMRPSTSAEEGAAHHSDLDSDGALLAAAPQQREHSNAGGAAATALSGSGSSRAQELSASITRSVSGSIGVDAAASGSGSTSKQYKLSSAGIVEQPMQQVQCRTDAMLAIAAASDHVVTKQATPHNDDGQDEGSMDCDDNRPVNSVCAAAAAAATTWASMGTVSNFPQLQLQQHTAAVSSFSAVPCKRTSSPELGEPAWMKDIGMAMADAEKECPVDRLLAPLEVPTSHVSLNGIAPAPAAAGLSDASLHSSSQLVQLAAPPAAAAAKKQHSRSASTTATLVAGVAAAPTALAGSDSSMPSRSCNSPTGSNTCHLARQVAAAVASLPGMALPHGRTLANVDQMAVPELLQWQQVLQLESKVWPADSPQSKQSRQAAEVVGMLAEYKAGQQHQTPQQQQQQPAASLQAAALPCKPVVQLQHAPQQSSSEMVDILQGTSAAGATPADAPAAAAGVNSAPLPPLCPRNSTSLSANGHGYAWRGSGTCTSHKRAPGAGTWSPAAMSTSPVLSTQHERCAQEQQQQQNVMLEMASLQSSLAPDDLVSVPSEVDHAMRLPMLPMKTLPTTALPPAPRSSNSDAAPGQKWHQGSAGGGLIRAPQPAVQQQQLLEQQEQLQVMQTLHLVQQQAMLEQQVQQQQQKLWQQRQHYLQQKQLLQQQQPAQDLTPEQLEDWKVDHELQLMLLEAEMQAALSAGGDSSTATITPNLASVGVYRMTGGVGVGTISACSNGLTTAAEGLACGHAQMQAIAANPYAACMPAACTPSPACQGVEQGLGQQGPQLALQQQMTWGSSTLLQQPAVTAAAGIGVHSSSSASWKSTSALALESALQIAHGGGAQASYAPVDSSMRLSLKLHNANPSQLQPDMLMQLNAMLGSANAAVECGFMRPGCVHLVLQVRAPSLATQQRVQPAAAAAAVGAPATSAAEVSQVLSALNGTAWASALTGSSDGLVAGDPLSVTMQLPNQEAVLIRGSAVTRTVKLLQQPAALRSSTCSSSDGAGVMQRPLLHAVVPNCICSSSSSSASFVAVGFGLAQTGTHVLVRMQGMFMPATVTPLPHQSATASSCHASMVRISVQQLQPFGLAYVEFQQGFVLSEARPVLVVDRSDVATELQEWSRQSSSSSSSKAQLEVGQVLVDFGRLLDFRAVVERHRSSSSAAVLLGSGLGGEPGSGNHGQQWPDGQHAAAGPTRHWIDINDSAHEGVPFAGVGRPPPAAATAPAADAVLPQPAAAPADGHSSFGASWPRNREITPADDSAPATLAVAAPAPANSCSGSSSSVSSEHTVSSSSSNQGQLWPAAAPGSNSRYKRLHKSLSSSLRALTHHAAATRADSAGSSSSSAPVSSSFGSRLKKKLGFVSRNSSFSLDCISELAAGGMSPVSRSDCGDDHLIRTAVALTSAGNARRAQSLDLSSNKLRTGLTSRLLGPFASASVTSSAAAESSSGGTTSFDSNTSSDLEIGMAVHEIGRQQQQEELQAHHQQQQHPQRSFDSNISGSSDVTMSVRQIDHQHTQQQAEQQEQQHQRRHAQADIDPELDGMPAEDDSAFGAAMVAALATLEPCPTEHPLLGPDYLQCVLDIGVRLLCFFADKGLAASSQLVLDIMLACAAPAASFAGIASAVAAADGLGLLHRAIRSGSTAMVLAVLQWGATYRYCFAWDAPGPMGLTPLHLLALLGQQLGSLGQLVLQSSPAAADMWFKVKAASGATPAMLASSLGMTALNRLAYNVVRKQQQERSLLLRQQQQLQQLHEHRAVAIERPPPQQQQQQQLADLPAATRGLEPQSLQPLLQGGQSPGTEQESQHRHGDEQQQQQRADVSARLKRLLQQDGANLQPSPEQNNEHQQQELQGEPASAPTEQCLQRQDHQQQPQEQQPQVVRQQQAEQQAASVPATSMHNLQQDCQPVGVSKQYLQDTPASLIVNEQQQQQQVTTEVQSLQQAEQVHSSTPSTIVGRHLLSQQEATAATVGQHSPGARDHASADSSLVTQSCSGPQWAEPHQACGQSSSSTGSCSQAADAPSGPDATKLQPDSFDAACSASSSCCKPVAAPCMQPHKNDEHVPYLGSCSCSSSRSPAGAGACSDESMENAEPTWAVTQVSRALLYCQQHLDATPWRLSALQWAATAVKAVLVLLLLAALLHHSQGLMLLTISGVVLVAMLQRLLNALGDSIFRYSLTDAESLQEQLNMLWSCARQPLAVPHSKWTLAFKDLRLENQYREVVASSRLPVDIAIAATIKTLVILLPVIARVGSTLLLRSSSAAATAEASAWLSWGNRGWSLPMSQQLAGVVAGALPLAAAMLSRTSYSSLRDSLLFVVQSLLLAVMRKPLLVSAAAASLTAGGVAGCCHPALFQSCLAAVLLLLFQQRMSCAVWQVLWGMIGSVLLLSGPGSVATIAGGAAAMVGSLTVLGWLQLLLPLLTLPVLYVWERVDRNMFLSAYRKDKQGKDV